MPVRIGKLTLYSIPDLEEKLGIQAITLRQYLRTGRIRGRKLAGKWYVSEEVLQEFFRQEDEAVGRKRKKAPQPEGTKK